VEEPKRADARRNQAQLLAAARDVFVERGPAAPLDEVARRAGVGIGTLYRRFADRDALLRAVVVDALERSRETAEEAAAWAGEGERDGLDGIARYMHAVLDLRVSAVVPLALERLDLDAADVAAVRDRSAAAVQALVDAAHEDGSLAEEISFGDIGTLLVRLSRPLPGPVPTDVNDELAHRHLDLVLAGLRAGPDVPGKGLSRAELRTLRERRAGQPKSR
jgi:AcrR family transcriptional regulator